MREQKQANRQSAYAALLAALLLNTIFAPLAFAPSPALADETVVIAPQESPSTLLGTSNLTLFFQAPPSPTPTPVPPVPPAPAAAPAPGGLVAAPAAGTTFACQTSSLSPQETQALQELLRDGIVGGELSAGTPKNKDSDKLDVNNLIVTNPSQDQNQAISVKIPNKKIEPFEASYLLGRYIDGAFGFGVVLSDSVRTARCEDLNRGCAVNAVNLQYRNSGAGIKADFKSVVNDFKDYLDGNAHSRGLTPEENETLRGFMSMEDANSFQYQSAARLKSVLMANSILADDFEARLQTNCMNAKCLINTYSMFDKYFNSWFSAQLVVSTAAPVMIAGARRLWSVGQTHGYLPKFENFPFMKALRKSKLLQPASYISRRRVVAATKKMQDAGYFESIVQPMTSWDPMNAATGGRYLAKSEVSWNWWGKQWGKEGVLSKVTSIEDQRVIVDYMNAVRKFSSSAKLLEEDADLAVKKAIKEFGLDSPAHKAALVEYGRVASGNALEFDDIVGYDWPEEWSKNNPNFTWRDYATKDALTGKYRPFIEEHRYYREAMRKFRNDGDFANWNEALTDGTRLETRGRNLLVYEPKPTGKEVGYLDVANLSKELPKVETGDFAVRLNDGTIVKVDHSTLPLIQQKATGQIPYYRMGWAEHVEVTPEMFAADLAGTRSRYFRANQAASNSERWYRDLLTKGYGGKRYTNILSKALLEEEDLLKTYFTLKGGFKWTAIPLAYDWLKRGFGSEDLSVYMLPDEWKDLMVYTKADPIYKDAYIDFFANEGSDQGNIFNQLLQKLPWKFILDEVSQKFNPLRDLYNSITKQELRSEVENLAYFMHSKENCPGCLLNIQAGNTQAPPDQWEFSPFFYVRERTNAYFLEDIETQRAREKGQTLVAFTHHTDLKGRSGDIDGGTIDLVKAKKDKKTCNQVISEKFMGLSKDSLFGGSRLGLALGTMETITYVMFFWAGVFSSAVQQIALAPLLQDCVDDEEGYFIHYFMPTEKAKKAAEGENELSTEKVAKKVGEFKDKFMGALKSDANSFTREVFDEVGGQVNQFVEQGMKNDILQATLSLKNNAYGQLHGIALFNFWCAPGCEIAPSEYITKGKKVIKDDKTNASLDFDFEKGKLTYTDKEGKTKDIVTSEDHVRLESTNTKIPAEEIPQTITKLTVPDNNKLMLEINADGMAYVKLNDILDCIQKGVKEQTGLPLSSNNLYDAFGRVKLVASDTHPVIKPTNEDGRPRIVAEGLPRKIAEGADAKLEVYTPLPGTKLLPVKLPNSSDGQPSLGSLKSVQFENGSITYKTTTGELLIYLKHHKQGVLEQNDVAGLKTKLETVTNPKTGCAEPAVQFEVQGNPDSPKSVDAAANFNKSLDKLGPFQVFETEDHRYILYTDEACKEHLRVIDKKTGAVQDFTGKAIQTPDGLKFVTDDGKEHTLKFSEKDGVPQVQFDGGKAETLRVAQGRNGAFYYDPETGLWYAENGQLIPLLEAFKQNGFNVQRRDDGSATAKAEGNVLNVNLGDKDAGNGLLNLPSLPEAPLPLAVFLFTLLLAFVCVRVVRIEIRK